MPLTSYSCAKCMASFKENSEVVKNSFGGTKALCRRCSYRASIRYLKNELPKEFFIEHMTTTPRGYVGWNGKNGGESKPSPAAELLYEQVIAKHSRTFANGDYKEWPGKHKDVHVWWELENGKAVGWNESPSKGWSFPVITIHNLKIWNGRGDYSDFDGHFYVCAPTAKRAVELLKQAGHRFINMHEFTGYYNAGAWGIAMRNQKREEGVWFTPEGEDDVMGGFRPRRLL